MLKFLIYLFLILIFSQTLYVQFQTKDVLDFDNIKINGETPLITRKNKVFQLLGKESKIELSKGLECVSYYYTETLFVDSYIYYGKSIFESYGDTLVLTSIDFESLPKIFLKHPKILLNNKTTIQEFLRKFPSAQPALEGVRAKEEQIFRVSPSKKKDNIDFWYFKFKKGKLIHLEYWMPC